LYEVNRTWILDQPIQRKTSGPPGQGRVVCRLWYPSETLNVADIGMNGVYVGSVELGGAIYRYVSPRAAASPDRGR